MRIWGILAIILVGFVSCKNNGQSTSTEKATASKVETVKESAQSLIIDPSAKPVKPDFRVLEMSIDSDVLTVLVSYGGGCEEHSFNAYFSGGWSKSLPPQAVLTFEHLNPNNDACRSIVKDTLLFDIKPLQYSASKEVMVKWAANPEKQVLYKYGR